MELLKHITAEDIEKYGVVGAPDKLEGDPKENKMVFDRLVREMVAGAFNSAVDVINATMIAAEGWSTEEAKRAAAELDRIAAENLRAAAETARATAETARDDAETIRETNEIHRQSRETAREQAEESRADAESAREAAEQVRKNQEATRAMEETARVNGEVVRRNNEQTRQNQESTRQTNEQTRQGQESTRQTQETTRQTNEQTRQTAEQSRVSGESARGTNEKARAAAEELRKSAEASRATAENLRASAETNRASAENLRAAAETDRASAEAGRKTAETGRVTAESKRETAETNRASAETARANAEQTRASAETSRANAEDLRATAETVRVNEEKKRVDAEAARVAAEKIREEAYQSRKVVQETGNSTTAVMSQAAVTKELNQLSNEKVDRAAIVQETGDSTTAVMSQAAVTNALASLKQTEVTFVSSVDEMTDTSKFYVLDGFIWAYMYVEATGPSYTNLSETVHENYRMGSGGALSALTGALTTDFIPVSKGQTVRFKGFNPLVMPSSKHPYICFYTAASESATVTSGQVWGRLDWLHTYGDLPETNGVYTYTAFLDGSGEAASAQHTAANSITHIRMCGTMLDGETVIVTVDEEITEGSSGGGYQWKNTGQAFAPADYESRILALENNKADKTAIPTTLPNPNALTIDGVKYDGSAAVNIETQSGGNILYGKKWVACGDSFTANGYNASDGFDESVYIYQDGRFAGRYKVYPNIIGLRNNMNVVNKASGGQTMGVSSNSFMDVYQTIDADADYITIMLGINDKLQSIPVGTAEDTANTTFCGCYNIAMEHILESHPFAHIGIMVSHGTNAEIMAATRQIAERWGVPYLDYGSPQVPLMNRYTGRNVCAKAQEIREKNFCIISDGTTPTNAHPNTAAHEFESTFIEAWLRTL